MKADKLEYYIDLTRGNLDPELFAAALTLQHISEIFTRGGSRIGRPDDEDALCPEHLERFVPLAFENAQRTKRFESQWKRLQQILPYIRDAWEKGQALFHDDLVRTMDHQEKTDYFSTIDFAVDCYAYISAKNTYPDNQALQAWAINGYMVAWREHFLNGLKAENDKALIDN